MKIAVDIMSGDNPPELLLEGALFFLSKFSDINLVIIGDKKLINKKLNIHPYERQRIEIVNSSEIIEMEDKPLDAYKKKKKSSIVIGTTLVRQNYIDGFFSPGNTGAVLTSALFDVGRIKGVKRPAIGAFVPNINDYTLLVDAGANTNVKPHFLFQFAIMGYVFVNKFFGKEKPKVGILSNGEEETKGNELTKATYELLKKTDLNFVGNVEGYNILDGSVDVVVCDGFTGNIALKVLEGTGLTLLKMLKTEIKKTFFSKIGGLLIKSGFKRVLKRMDAREYGGAPLLGVDGEIIIGHGNSDDIATYNGIKLVRKMIELDIKDEIHSAIKKYK